jgi:DNA/RNA-binding domain of Phe-tRNA-synthetase-like protein
MIDVGIDPDVAAAFPDYRALIVVAEGVGNGPSDDASDALLREAEGAYREAGGSDPTRSAAPDAPHSAANDAPGAAAADATRSAAPDAPRSAANDAPHSPLARAADHPHIAAWRAAFSAFGAKPSRFPSSVEALLSRVLKGQDLPRVSRLVDLYNAISVRHVVPVGGEDLDRIEPPMRLVRARGDEPFDLREGDEVEHPRPGEVVWRDAVAVTCRRWNWRQGRRTALTDSTTRALFVFDRLEPMGIPELNAAAGELTARLEAWWPGCRVERTLLGE